MTERKQWTTTIPSEDIPGILRTIRLFLENIKFNETIKALEAEIKTHNFHVASNSTPKFLILTPSSISTSCKKHTTDLDYYPVNIYPKCYRVQSVENATSSQDIDVCYAEEIHPHSEESLECVSSKEFVDNLQKDCQKLMCVTFRLLESIKIQVNEYTRNEPEDCIKSSTIKSSSVDDIDLSPPKQPMNNCKIDNVTENAKEFGEEVETNTSGLSTSDSNELSELYNRHFDQLKTANKSTNESFTETNWCNDEFNDSNTQKNEENQTDTQDLEKTTFNRQITDCERNANEMNARQCCCTVCTDEEQVMEDGQEVSYTEYAVAYGAVAIDDYFPLDFHRVKYHLFQGTDLTKELLLQALRWRITQTSDEIRNREMEFYIKHNILGLKSEKGGCQFSAPIIKKCLEREPDINGEINDVQTNAARLLNCFASLKVGRDYLCEDEQFLKGTLLPFVIKQRYISMIVQDMLIATLQKMSLRKRPRQTMIAEGLIQYLVTFLTANYQSLNDYCLEYAVALLMNLCLQREAKCICRSIASQLLRLLTTLLRTTRECCMPYVNGTLFAILKDKTINAEAKNEKLGAAILEQAKLTKNLETRNQLEFIYKMHMKDNFDICPCRSNTGPEDEIDLLEPELDIADSVKGRYYGESLLQFYRLEGIKDECQSSLKCFCKPASLNRNVKPYNIVEQGIVPTRRKNSVKVTYEVYLDPAEQDKLIEKIIEEDAEGQSEQSDIQSDSECDKKRVSFKESNTTLPEDIHSIPQMQEHEQHPETQEKGQQAEAEDEDVQLLETSEQQSQTEAQLGILEEEPQTDEQCQQTEEQLSTEEKFQQTQEQQLSTEEQCLQTEEQEKIYEEAGEEYFEKTEIEHFGSIENLKESVETDFPSALVYGCQEEDSKVEPTENKKDIEESSTVTKTPPNTDAKNNVKRPTTKPVPKHSTYPSKPRPQNYSELTKHCPTIPNHGKQNKKQENAIASKTKPGMDKYKQSNLAECRPLKPKCDHTNRKLGTRMQESYFGCYKDYSDVGRLFLTRKSPGTCVSTEFCPEYTKRNKYSCSCYDKIKCYVDQLDNANCNNVNDNYSNCTSNNTYTCHNVRCHMMDWTTPECERSTPDHSSHTVNFRNRNVCQFSQPDDVDMTIPYYNCDVLCEDSNTMQSNQCHYYNNVFQSRPKIGRTPPH